MKNLVVKYLIFGAIVLVVIVGVVAWKRNDNNKTNAPPLPPLQADTTAEQDIYQWPKEDRNQFLLYGNQEKQYQAVVNFTDTGIQNHRELIWDDIDFWNHRGFALYELGDKAKSLAAFYHVLMREPDNEVANAFILRLPSEGNPTTK